MDQVGIEAPCLYALRVLARGVESAAEHVAHAAEIARVVVAVAQAKAQPAVQGQGVDQRLQVVLAVRHRLGQLRWGVAGQAVGFVVEHVPAAVVLVGERSEEHTSELQSLMRNSYAVFCLKTKKKAKTNQAEQLDSTSNNVYNMSDTTTKQKLKYTT